MNVSVSVFAVFAGVIHKLSTVRTIPVRVYRYAWKEKLCLAYRAFTVCCAYVICVI
jgi:hypothetical protein